MRRWLLVAACLLLTGCMNSAEERVEHNEEIRIEPVVIEQVPEGMLQVAYEIDNMGRSRTQYWAREDGELVIDTDIPITELQRGDIVYFETPPYERELSKYHISRVMALPGERVAIREGHIWIEGRPLETFYAPATKSGLERDAYLEFKQSADPEFELSGYEGFHEEMAELLVPDGQFFVVGDNRWRSIDSRHFGPLPGESIEGKVIGVTGGPLNSGGNE